jgi:hypothetical protein
MFVTFTEPRLHSGTQQKEKDQRKNVGPLHIVAVSFRKTQISFDVTANETTPKEENRSL